MINEANLIPNNTIVVVTDDDRFNNRINEVVEGLDKTRDWFTNEFYHCLPIIIGNQYGFGIKSTRTFEVVWSGKTNHTATKIKFLDEENDIQSVVSHFGSGIITFQNRFHFRTSPGINLITMPAPNHMIPGIQPMTAVIESDNLRKDFTFNLKITIPNQRLIINKGDFISAIMPIKRYEIDKYKIVEASQVFNHDLIEAERDAIDRYNEIRSQKHLRKGPTKLYMLGKDQYGKKFKDHQKSIDKTNQK